MRIGARGKLFLVTLALLVGSLAAAEIYLLPAIEHDLTERIRQDLGVRLHLVAERAATYARSPNGSSDWGHLADKLGPLAQARVTFIQEDGRVVGDSDVLAQNLGTLENHRERPEVAAAFDGRATDNIRYSATMHLQQPRIENHKLGPLPQLFADQFGWEEMAATVASIYNGLPADVRAGTAIFAQNYSQAGAVDLFGPKNGLPKAISGHQSYYLWGPRDYTGESMIVMDDRQERLEGLFATVEKAASVYHPYSMPYEHFDVFYCRGLKQPLSEFWPQVKHWD